MTHLKTNLFKFGMILLSFFAVLSFFSCATSNVEDSVVEVEKNDSHPSEKNYFAVYLDMMMPGSSSVQEISDFLDNWEKEVPKDPELFKAKFLHYLNLATIIEDNSDVFILPGTGYTLIPDETTGELCYFYKDKTIILETFLKAVLNLKKGIELYPTRYDYWDCLIMNYTMLYLYNDAKEATLLYLDTVEKAEASNADWYTNNNEKINFETKIDKENYIIDIISFYTKNWLSKYPTDESVAAVKEVALRTLEIFPNNSLAYNNAGLAFMETNEIDKAIPYFEKAYAIEPTYLPISFNLALCAAFRNDYETFEKYSNVIYNSGDEEFIKYYNDYINRLLQM